MYLVWRCLREQQSTSVTEYASMLISVLIPRVCDEYILREILLYVPLTFKVTNLIKNKAMNITLITSQKLLLVTRGP